jgi:hypothetical protein
MTGVLKVRTGGAWVDVFVPGPPGPTGATGPQGPQGPAGPQQQRVLFGANPAFLSVGVATWTEYGIATITLPWTGTWLVRVFGNISANVSSDMQLSIGIGHTNHWRPTIPWVQNGTGGGTMQVMMEEPFALGAGAVDFSAFVWVSGGGGGFRYGNVILSYFGP